MWVDAKSNQRPHASWRNANNDDCWPCVLPVLEIARNCHFCSKNFPLKVAFTHFHRKFQGNDSSLWSPYPIALVHLGEAERHPHFYREQWKLAFSAQLQCTVDLRDTIIYKYIQYTVHVLYITIYCYILDSTIQYIYCRVQCRHRRLLSTFTIIK